MIIEQVILEYLKGVLDVPVFVYEPENPPTSFVLILKTGSSRENYINKSTVLFRSYGKTLYDCAVLNESVKEAVKNMIILDGISKCKLNSDYNYPDTAKKKNRYQAVFDITHY